jgi:branched-chain amino acid transport system ATP-binding protein|nr:ABC transporter ATP-binding protein [Sneathiella sp.]|tara:strand:- start:9191 stop:10063 length:873 start_codon:yes stop_codon:yes gene_type:complete
MSGAPPRGRETDPASTTAEGMTATSSALLELTNVQIFYDKAIEAVRDVSLSVKKGSLVALLGANGAGKTTVLKAISGILFPEDGTVEGGTIEFDGKNIAAMEPDEIVRSGIVLVPEGRQLFDTLTVEENLIMGGYTTTQRNAAEALERIYDMFPALTGRRHSVSGYLSGGEQQMVALGRALMSKPKLLMLDEPTLGLAPQIIEEIFSTISALVREEGTTVLLVEQNAQLALSVADYGYIMENGRVVLDDTPERLLRNDDICEFYLGFSDAGARKNMRDVKHYKRRKRWLS